MANRASSFLKIVCSPTPAAAAVSVEDFQLGQTLQLELSETPSRSELKLLASFVKLHLPEDPTPSLNDIAASPEVPHLGEPQLAPQREHLLHPVRLHLVGPDAFLHHVVSFLMRQDLLWAELALEPTSPNSTIAQLWPCSDPEHGVVKPAPCIRDDAGQVVLGAALITSFEQGKEITGEVIVDSKTLLSHDGRQQKTGWFKRHKKTGIYGARLVPTPGAPGLAAAVVTKTAPLTLAGETLLTGRALQVGGVELQISADQVARPRAVDRATFYRHLRDLQLVRD